MLKLKKGDIEYYAFNNFTNHNIVHGFPNRKNGFSKGDFASLDFSYSNSEDTEAVKNNYIKLSNTFEITDYVYGKQIHTKNVSVITEEEEEFFFKNNDGFVCDCNKTLFTYHADCGSVFLYDVITDVFGLLHSGWRGTALNITKEALNIMIGEFGCRASDIIVGVGPSICYECFEVDRKVAKTFIKEGYKTLVKYDNYKDKYFVDIKNIIKTQCMDMGIPMENIELAQECTLCNENEFFSHRRSGTNRGTHIGFLKKR
ncbi:MAG: peptidoglycan editing factor PgeF [Lachnospirales bacterium]